MHKDTHYKDAHDKSGEHCGTNFLFLPHLERTIEEKTYEPAGGCQFIFSDLCAAFISHGGGAFRRVTKDQDLVSLKRSWRSGRQAMMIRWRSNAARARRDLGEIVIFSHQTHKKANAHSLSTAVKA